jgi:beta-glucosidase
LAPQQNFSEGLYIDYRHFDKQDIAPRYEFGYGLSYTTFELSSLEINAKGKKTALPAARPEGIAPPSYSTELPDPESALFPEGFNKVEKYIYPWIESTKGIKKPNVVTSQLQSPLSDAGGGPGGNPDLYTTILTVSASVANTGSLDGSTVVQLYISLPQGYKDHETGEPVDFPVRVLRGFEKPHIKHGDKEQVTFEVTRRDLSYWDAKRQNWVMPNTGEIGIAVGFSSRDLALQGTW